MICRGLHLGMLIAVIGLPGCLNPMTTRLPTFNIGSPEAEKKAQERFDPFPDSTLGPNTFSRPRGYVHQREQSRRAIEFNQKRPPQYLQPLPGYPAYPGTVPTPGSTPYPGTMPNDAYPAYPGYPSSTTLPPSSNMGSAYPNVVQP